MTSCITFYCKHSFISLKVSHIHVQFYCTVLTLEFSLNIDKHLPIGLKNVPCQIRLKYNCSEQEKFLHQPFKGIAKGK